MNPLHWLADLATPDGKMPPLDDGHKREMYNAGVLAWKGGYGNNDIGEKFASIAGRVKSSLSGTLYPVEIAIPRRPLSDSGSPDGIFGNEFDERTNGESGRQEVVLRRTIANKQHYVLLNGESGDAILRGEGHEQGDQMQLLYYVDDISYLIDSGYDKPVPPKDLSRGWRRSTWNNYSDHNVMQVQGLNPDYHGVSPPHLDLPNTQVESDHQSVNRIHRYISGNIYHLAAFIDLKTPDEIGNLVTASYYQRNIFFIADEKDPYLIDLNSVLSQSPQPPLTGTFVHRMTYRGNSNNAAIEKQDERRYVVWHELHKSEDSTDPTPSDNKLFIQPFVFEQPLQDTTLKTVTVREPYIRNQARGAGVNVKMLEFDNLPWYDNRENTLNNEYSFSTVAFIKALAGNDSIPDLVKSNIIPPDSSSILSWQYYTWKHDTSTVDVFAVRHAQQFFSHYPDPDSSLIVVSEADSVIFYMPGNQNFGFVRLIKNNTSYEWSIDHNYYANLVSGTLASPEPLTVNISGPDCIDSENSTGRFVASPSGSVFPYSYSWSSYRICEGARRNARSGPECNAWSNAGTTRTIDYGGYNGDDFKVRVRVTDSSSPRQSVTSGELQVRVLSSTEGSCSGDALGKTEADAETLASDANLLEVDESIPETYALRQNFPNPFNPSTEILFDLPEDTMVSLIVYDVLGREVSRLVQKELRAGTHRTRFDAGNLPSGVYFYRIQAGDFSHIHRMVLLK